MSYSSDSAFEIVKCLFSVWWHGFLKILTFSLVIAIPVGHRSSVISTNNTKHIYEMNRVWIEEISSIIEYTVVYTLSIHAVMGKLFLSLKVEHYGSVVTILSKVNVMKIGILTMLSIVSTPWYFYMSKTIIGRALPNMRFHFNETFVVV